MVLGVTFSSARLKSILDGVILIEKQNAKSETDFWFCLANSSTSFSNWVSQNEKLVDSNRIMVPMFF
jgi:hypothetical protein